MGVVKSFFPADPKSKCAKIDIAVFLTDGQT